MFKWSPPLQEPEFQTLRAQDSNLPQMIHTFYNFTEIFDIAISQDCPLPTFQLQRPYHLH